MDLTLKVCFNFKILLSTSISSILHHLKTPHTPYLDNFSQMLLEVTICVRILRMFDKMRHAGVPCSGCRPQLCCGGQQGGHCR